MVITYYGITCFKIEAHGVSLAINPFSKTPGLSAPRFEAAIILATNNSYQNASLPGNPYIICGPGEYDIASATIRSIKLHPNNTAYIIEWDELRLMHLGEFNDGGETDDKVIAVLSEDKRVGHIKSVADLGEQFEKETTYYWEHYKDLKKPGTGKVEGFFDTAKAKEIIKECIERYNKEYKPKMEESCCCDEECDYCKEEKSKK